MKNILITGGAGYIGSHLANYFINKNIFILDDLSTGDKRSINHNCKFILGNCGDYNLVFEICKKNNIETIFHLAGSLDVSESVLKPNLYFENNSVNTFFLIKAALDTGVKNFIFSSTAAVYGNSNNNKKKKSENDQTTPITPYGKSKLIAENFLKEMANKKQDFNYAILRYFNVAGNDYNIYKPKIGLSNAHLIKKISECIIYKKRFYVYGDDYKTYDGTCIRDYIHIYDLIKAHIKAKNYLLNKKKNIIINCGYGTGFSVFEILKAAKKISNVDINYKISKKRRGDIDQVISDNKRIKKLLNWKPKFNSIENIIKSQIESEKFFFNKL